jgi:hypothetical protein
MLPNCGNELHLQSFEIFGGSKSLRERMVSFKDRQEVN